MVFLTLGGERMTARNMNGIDLDKSRAARDLIRADGDGLVAKPQYRSTVVWDKGYHTRARVTDGQEVIGDEPVRYGGSGTGLTPQDMLLTAVGHCLAATYIGGLSAAGIAVESLRLDVSGRVNFRAAYGVESGNPGFENIQVKVDIQTDSAQEEVNRILDGLLGTAPIPDTIMRPVPLDVEISCTQAEAGAGLS